MNALEKLRQLVGEIQQTDSPANVQPAWDLAGRLLGRMPVDQARTSQTISAKDTAALDAIVSQLENPQELETKPAPTDEPAVSEKEMAAALRAFRKRLKLARLADESKLGNRQMTSGRTSDIDAIIPPHEYPLPVWKALVDSGKLKYTGQGFYSL